MNSSFSSLLSIIGITLIIILFFTYIHYNKKYKIFKYTSNKLFNIKEPFGQLEDVQNFNWDATQSRPNARIYEAPNNTNYDALKSASDAKFDIYLGPKKQSTIVSFPINRGPSIQFAKTTLDDVYKKYAEKNLAANPVSLKNINDIEIIPPPPRPQFGSQLTSIDINLAGIPWDADNIDKLATDILWGTVSPNASMSIYQKVYGNTVVSDPSYKPPVDVNTINYTSFMFNITATDEIQSRHMQATDNMVLSLAPQILETGYKMASSAWKSLLIRNATNKLESGQELTASERQAYDIHKAEVAQKANAAREKKISMGIALSDAEELEHAAYRTKHNSTISPRRPIKARTTGITESIKRILGIRRAQQLASTLIAPFKNMIASIGRTIASKIGLKAAITGTLNGLSALIGATSAAVAVIPGAQALLTIMSYIASFVFTAASLWNTLDLITLPVMLSLQILIPTIYGQAISAGGTCPSDSRSLEKLIDNELLYQVVTQILPIGSLFGILDPYFCFMKNGTIVPKDPLYIPPYYSDSTLSLYKHVYPPSLEARGDSTTKIPASCNWVDGVNVCQAEGWVTSEGFMFKNCRPGTSAEKASLFGGFMCNPNQYTAKSIVKPNIPVKTNKKAIRSVGKNIKIIGSVVRSTSSSGSVFCDNNTFYNPVDGTCTSVCPPGQIDHGAFCSPKCLPNEVTDNNGNCIVPCRTDQIDKGDNTCQDICPNDYPTQVGSTCYGICPVQYSEDMGNDYICKQPCAPPYSKKNMRNGVWDGTCSSDEEAYQREIRLPGATFIYDPGYNPPRELKDVTLDWCNFASPIMLDRMAQFYYDNSIRNLKRLDDGRVSYEYIVMFYGVIASSELSCDVACSIMTCTFDPITGDKFETSIGAEYNDNPNMKISYRRFYFIKMDQASINAVKAVAAINNREPNYTLDPQGIFTVTGCTNTDYTAPDAMVDSRSTDVDPVISVPKVFDVIEKRTPPINPRGWDQQRFNASSANVAFQLGVMAVGAKIGGIKGEAVTTALMIAPMFRPEMLGFLPQDPPDLNVFAENIMVTTTPGNPTFDSLYISTNNDNFSINHGPIYERRAAYNSGIIPTITFCGPTITSQLLCSHEFILRDTINLYHYQNPTKHIKSVNIIEPRGLDGCYYKWDEVSYDPATDVEEPMKSSKEVVLIHEIRDYTTCIFSPTSRFVTDELGLYPIRSYVDPITHDTMYPTREVKHTAVTRATKIRIRPSQILNSNSGSGSGNRNMSLEISQIAVYDNTGENVARGALTTPTSLYNGSDGISAASSFITNGYLSPRVGITNIWRCNDNDIQNQYVDITLPNQCLIDHIVYYGRLDSKNSNNNLGVRIQLINGSVVIDERITPTPDTIQHIDFTAENLMPIDPVAPFIVPFPPPREANLGDSRCPARCQDRAQIDSMLQQYNLANPGANIVNVLKAVTPTNNRCDYQVEIMRTVNAPASGSGSPSKTIGIENISMTAALQSTSSGGVVYGRYVRLKAASIIGDGILQLSQVVILDPTGTNIALNMKTYATSTNNNGVSVGNDSGTGGSRLSSSVVDGTLTARDAPNIWQVAGVGAAQFFNTNTVSGAGVISGNFGGSGISESLTESEGSLKPVDRDFEYWEVDLGKVKGISSITVYGSNPPGQLDRTGRAIDRITGIRIQVLNTNEFTAHPVFEVALSNSTSPQKYEYNKCNFRYSLTTPQPESYFIRDTTPLLYANDTSGGVFTFSSLTSGIKNIFNNLIKPFDLKRAVNSLNLNATLADTTANTILSSLGANIIENGFTGCPTVKCSDPAVLSAIMNRYNTDNSSLIQYGAETHTMTSIIKAGLSGPTSCDVMFNDLYELYDDILYPPLTTDNTTMALRFSMVDSGGCVIQVAGGTSYTKEIPMTSIGLKPARSQLSTPFSTTCKVNPVDPTLLRILKVALEKKYVISTANTRIVPTFTTVQQSYVNGTSICEYMMTKDITTTNIRLGRQTTETNIDTYVTAKFIMNPTTCSFTLDESSIVEFLPDDVTTETDAELGIDIYYVNGVQTTMPFIFSYDGVTTPTNVNTNTYNLS